MTRAIKVGVLSDTHIPKKAKALPDEVLRGFEGCSLILHAGDIMERGVIARLEQIAPVMAVAGNNDPPDLLEELGLTKIVEFEGIKIGLTHGHKGGRGTTMDRAIRTFQGVDCIVFGHNHFPYNAIQDGVLIFNPGSPTDKRRIPQPSYGLLFIGSDIGGEIVYF